MEFGAVHPAFVFEGKFMQDLILIAHFYHARELIDRLYFISFKKSNRFSKSTSDRTDSYCPASKQTGITWKSQD